MSGGLSIRPQTLHLAPQYRRLRDTLLRPQLRITESRYFWERWKPRLGPDAAVLVMEVRDRCNRALASAGTPPPTGGRESDVLNHVTGESSGGASEGSEGCTVSAAELAAACGFSRVTLWRLLQREEVRRFVRVEHNYVYDRRLGKKRRTLSTYHVLMEDPLVQEDEARLDQLLATAPDPPTMQNEMLVVDNSAPRFQLATNTSGSISKPQDVPETIFKERLETNGQTALHARPATRAVRSMKNTDAISTPIAPAGGQPRSVPEVDMWKKYPELAHFVEEAETLLDDRHSRGFYLKALKRLYPSHLGVWQRALGMAREQANIRRSRGALFTRLLRTFAAEAGVEL